MNDNVNIEVWVSTDKIGSKRFNVIVFNREDWKSMSQTEREEVMINEVWNMAEWGWKIIGDDDEN